MTERLFGIARAYAGGVLLRKLQTVRAPMRHTRSDELRHTVDVALADLAGVDDHVWIADAPQESTRPWSAIEIRIADRCDARCVHAIERRLLSLPGVVGLGPHWPRPRDDDRILALRIYRGHDEPRMPR